MKTITVDHDHSIRSLSFHARNIWQALFNIYRKNGGSLNDMDCLILDLYHIEHLLKSRKLSGRHDFLWSFEGAYTCIKESFNRQTVRECRENYVRIVVDDTTNVTTVHYFENMDEALAHAAYLENKHVKV